MDYNRGVLYRIEYQLHCIANDGGNTGVGQRVYQMAPANAYTGTKGHCMQVCQDLLNQYKAEGDGFLDHTVTGDEMWCHYYKPESEQQPME